MTLMAEGFFEMLTFLPPTNDKPVLNISYLLVQKSTEFTKIQRYEGTVELMFYV